MNILNILPKNLRESYKKNLTNANILVKPESYLIKLIFNGLILAFALSLALFYFIRISPILLYLISFTIIEIFFYYVLSLKAAIRIKKIETVFPDFVQLIASNLRAGMTIDRAFMSSARPEFAPLDKEIRITGNEILTGQDIVSAFNDMSVRINSEKISKTITLILSGIKAGGNISTLLETTASNMREKEFLEKRAASNVLMYVIFIFVAVGAGAPVLFGLSSVLVEIIISLTKQLPAEQIAQINMPFTLSNVAITPAFIVWFSVIFLISVDILSCLIIGLVNKGDEKYGLKSMPPLIIVSLAVFFFVRIFIYRFLAESFSLAT